MVYHVCFVYFRNYSLLTGIVRFIRNRVTIEISQFDLIVVTLSKYLVYTALFTYAQYIKIKTFLIILFVHYIYRPAHILRQKFFPLHKSITKLSTMLPHYFRIVFSSTDMWLCVANSLQKQDTTFLYLSFIEIFYLELKT